MTIDKLTHSWYVLHTKSRFENVLHEALFKKSIEVFLPKILDNRFDHGYPMDNAYKDMVGVCRISSDEKIPIPVVHAAFSTYQTALKSGYGKEDKGAMIKIFENLLKVEFRKKER